MPVGIEWQLRLVSTLILVIVVLVIGSGAARAATMPTPEQAAQPSRNAADFDAPPWDSATLQEATSKNYGVDARAQARPVKARGARATDIVVRSAHGVQRVRAAHAGLVICGATPSMTRLGFLISAGGSPAARRKR